MSVGGVGSQNDIAELMQLLNQQQEKTVALAKKMVQVSVGLRVAGASQDGLGENLDVTA